MRAALASVTNGVLDVVVEVLLVVVVFVVVEVLVDAVLLLVLLLLLLLLPFAVELVSAGDAMLLVACLASFGDSGVAAIDVGTGCMVCCDDLPFFGVEFDTAIAFDDAGGTYDDDATGTTISSWSLSLSCSLIWIASCRILPVNGESSTLDADRVASFNFSGTATSKQAQI